MADTSTSRFDFRELVARAEPDRAKYKEPAYEFSNGRKFDSPGEFGGVYVYVPPEGGPDNE